MISLEFQKLKSYLSFRNTVILVFILIPVLITLVTILTDESGESTKLGTASFVMPESQNRCEKGEKPGGSLADVVTVVATILAIDPDKPSVTLQGPEGHVVEVLVKQPEKLKQVEVGDQVVITYSQAVAISVTAAPGN